MYKVGISGVWGSRSRVDDSLGRSRVQQLDKVALVKPHSWLGDKL